MGTNINEKSDFVNRRVSTIFYKCIGKKQTMEYIAAMIGLFDSGFGGLTIQHVLLNKLSQYSYMYLGDNAHAPYGPKSDEEIYSLTQKGVEYLFQHGCELVILACNTASASALRRLQQEWLPTVYPDKKVLGVIAPTVEEITGTPWHQVEPLRGADKKYIGVLATEHTVKTNAYVREVQKRNPSIQVIQQACPGLAKAIEAYDAAEISQLINKYVQALLMQCEEKNISLQAVLLGCTHYEFIAQEIRNKLSAEVHVYSQPAIVAESLRIYLQQHPEIEQKLSREQKRIYLTTSSTAHPSAIYKKLFHTELPFKTIS